MRIRHITLIFFSGVEHQKADWLGIHEKICQNLIPLRQSAPFLPSEEERQHRERQLSVKKVGSGPEAIKLYSCSSQLSMKLILLINVKMPTIVGIFKIY